MKAVVHTTGQSYEIITVVYSMFLHENIKIPMRLVYMSHNWARINSRETVSIKFYDRHGLLYNFVNKGYNISAVNASWLTKRPFRKTILIYYELRK